MPRDEAVQLWPFLVDRMSVVASANYANFEEGLVCFMSE